MPWRLQMSGMSAIAEIDVDASPEEVWKALTDPSMIQQYMFGSVVETDWRPGSPIVWRGEWEGKPFADKGTVLELQPSKYLKLTHFSPMSGQQDLPENYHTVEYELSNNNETTHLRLIQDGNATEDEVEHSKQNWIAILEALKRVVEEPRT